MYPQPTQNAGGQNWSSFYSKLNALHGLRLKTDLRGLETARRFLEAGIEYGASLDDAARQAHLSKYHFLRMFKEAFHETPHRYLRRLRLETAQRLLTRTELPVTDICFRVGFESLGTFCTLFRRFAGRSPGAFRRRYVVVPRSVVAPERIIPFCWQRRYVASPELLQPSPQF